MHAQVNNEDGFVQGQDNSNDEDEDTSQVDASETGNHTRRPRNSIGPQGTSSPRNASYYGPTFKLPLAHAKNDWQHYLATENPWPNRRDHFGKATAFLAHRVKESKENGTYLEREYFKLPDRIQMYA